MNHILRCKKFRIQKNVFTVLVLVPLFYSCDPMRRIQMKNESSGEVIFKWKLKEDQDRLSINYFRISNSDELEFRLQNKKPLNFVNMSFGLGSWTPEYLQTVSKQLVSLKIYTGGDSTYFDSPEKIYIYLINHRKGFGKSKILLTVH